MSEVRLNENDKEKQFILHDNLLKVMFNFRGLRLSLWSYMDLMQFDAIFVGRFVGETALAGVSLTYPLTQIGTAFGSLIGVDAGSVLSIALGANDKKTVRKLFGCANRLS